MLAAFKTGVETELGACQHGKRGGLGCAKLAHRMEKRRNRARTMINIKELERKIAKARRTLHRSEYFVTANNPYFGFRIFAHFCGLKATAPQKTSNAKAHRLMSASNAGWAGAFGGIEKPNVEWLNCRIFPRVPLCLVLMSRFH